MTPHIETQAPILARLHDAVDTRSVTARAHMSDSACLHARAPAS